MKYICPTCGKSYDVNYCDECKKLIELPNDISAKNAMLIWGIIMISFGFLGVFVGISTLIGANAFGVYWIMVGVMLAVTGIILLGISAVVARLNAIIRLMKEKS